MGSGGPRNLPCTENLNLIDVHFADSLLQILAGAFARLLKDNPEKAAGYGGAAAFFIFLYTAVFGATWLTIPWVYPTEVSGDALLVLKY